MSVYFIREVGTHFVKIGYTENLDNRLSALRTGSASELQIEFTAEGNYKTERELHEALAQRRVRGEWFSLPLLEVQSFLQHNVVGRKLRLTHGQRRLMFFREWLYTCVLTVEEVESDLLDNRYFKVTREQCIAATTALSYFAGCYTQKNWSNVKELLVFLTDGDKHQATTDLACLVEALFEYYNYLKHNADDTEGMYQCAVLRSIRLVQDTLSKQLSNIVEETSDILDRSESSFIGAHEYEGV